MCFKFFFIGYKFKVLRFSGGQRRKRSEYAREVAVVSDYRLLTRRRFAHGLIDNAAGELYNRIVIGVVNPHVALADEVSGKRRGISNTEFAAHIQYVVQISYS